MNTNISKDDIFQYINSLNERIEYLETELQKVEAYKDAESTLIKMLKTSQKAIESAEEQVAAAKRRNEAAIKFLEEHMAKSDKPSDNVSAETAAEEPEKPDNDINVPVVSDLSEKADDAPIEITNDEANLDSVNDALGLGDIFKIFKN